MLLCHLGDTFNWSSCHTIQCCAYMMLDYPNIVYFLVKEFITFIFFIFCGRVWGCMWHSNPLQVRRSNSCHESWWQASPPAEPCHQPLITRPFSSYILESLQRKLWERERGPTLGFVQVMDFHVVNSNGLWWWVLDLYSSSCIDEILGA